MRILLCLVGLLAFPAYSACNAPQHDQFDFWLGEWQVYSQGKKAGTNSITQDLNNCVIREHYHTPNGFEGRSLNMYYARDKQWHQTWMDNQGQLLQLSGELIDGTMTLQGQGVNREGAAITHRIQWFPMDGDRVRQLWQVRTDSQAPWQTIFDGEYRRHDHTQAE